jgi:ribosome-associated heat shock protein Hsp15
LRIDRLLCYLRFVKTRSQAHQLVDEGHIRCNGTRVARISHEVANGDVLTIPLGNEVRIAEVLTLPDRRGPPSEAQACYRLLDP